MGIGQGSNVVVGTLSAPPACCKMFQRHHAGLLKLSDVFSRWTLARALSASVVSCFRGM